MWPLKRPKIFFKTDYCLILIKSIADCSLAPREQSAILLTCIKLLSVFKTLVLSNFEWPLKTVFTVIDNQFMLLKAFLRLGMECYLGSCTVVLIYE